MSRFSRNDTLPFHLFVTRGESLTRGAMHEDRGEGKRYLIKHVYAPTDNYATVSPRENWYLTKQKSNG